MNPPVPTLPVRTFRASDARTALAAVKEALGADAVILSTRQVEGTLFRKPEFEVTASPPHGVTLAVLPPLPPPRPARPAPAPAPADEARSVVQQDLVDLRRSVEEARRAMAQLSLQARRGQELRFSPLEAEAFERLTGRGVEPLLAEELVRQATGEGACERPAMQAALRGLLARQLPVDLPPWQAGRRVVALVGPTGVGKTTTIAKLAARALMESRQKVALVTVDTYRIGAAEQLARYGDIMGIACHVARDRAELLRVVARAEGCDLVLIDTAGRSLLDDVLRQADLVRSVPGVDLHVVLSAASGAMELAAVAERYRVLGPDHLLLTKVDEAAGPGGFVSAAVRIGRPISAVCNGQRVPEDLLVTTSADLTDLVVGPWS